MGPLFRALLRLPLLRPIVRPLTRFLVGALAIPLFRLFLKRVVRLQDLDAELEKDLEQWFRASLVLLVATKNMEQSLFGWFLDLSESGTWPDTVLIGFRLLMAISVVELMPDQELFAIIHPGPPSLKFSREYGILRELREKWKAILKGVVCQHLNRSSPVFAMLGAIAGGPIGWVCYGVAVTQYLIIGLVTSKDKALDVLSEFDRQVAIRRRELVEEFHGMRQQQDVPEGGLPGEDRDGAGKTDEPPAADADESTVADRRGFR